MRVLLIEDDPHTAAFIAKGLREDGHTVEHAGDGREGLFLATTESFDAVVLDRMLPALDGLVLLQTLRGAGNRTPVLLLTALAGSALAAPPSTAPASPTASTAPAKHTISKHKHAGKKAAAPSKSDAKKS